MSIMIGLNIRSWGKGMSHVWYASEKVQQGMRISTVVNDTIIQISLMKLKSQGFSIDENISAPFDEIEIILQVLREIVESLEGKRKGGKMYFSANIALKDFVEKLIRKRAGDVDQLITDLNFTIKDLMTFKTSSDNDPEKTLLLLNELYDVAINSVDHNMDLILVPTG